MTRWNTAFTPLLTASATTGTAWLGLTVGCAQCHTHKFDPITQREYYRFMACLDNADEPTLDVTTPDITAKRNAIEAQAQARTAKLAEQFPPESGCAMVCRSRLRNHNDFRRKCGQRLPDNSLRLSGVNPDTDTYTVTLDSDRSEVSQVNWKLCPMPRSAMAGRDERRTATSS